MSMNMNLMPDDVDDDRGFWDKAKDFYRDHIKEHINLKNAFYAAAAIPVLAIGALIAYAADGETVFKGNVGGYNVKYTEDNGLVFGEENVMELERYGRYFRFVDSSGETNIEWKKARTPEFGDDKVETIEWVTKDGQAGTMHRSQMKEQNTVHGSSARETFPKADKLYNDIRTEIRDRLRRKHLDSVKDLSTVFD